MAAVFGLIKSCFYWSASIAAGIFSLLFVLGIMVEVKERWQGASGPRLTGAGPEDAEEQVPAGHAYEVSAMKLFLAASTSGLMPGGNRAELPLFPEAEMPLVSTKKYAEWAPEPFDTLPGPQGIVGAPAESPPPLMRWMLIMSGMDAIMAEALGSRTPPLTVERSFKSVKTKVWLGMAPVSEARWRSKGLDKFEHVEEALAIIEQVIDVWKHLAKPEINGELRTTNNKLWAEMDVFQDAANAMYKARGDPAPAWSMTKLWEAFNEHHFTHMEQQSRAWTLGHLKTLHAVFKTRFIDTFQSGRVLSSSQTTVKIDHYDMMILHKIQELQFDADVYIRRRFDGWVTAHRTIHPLMGNLGAPKAELDTVYAGIEKSRMQAVRTAFEAVAAERTRLRRAEGPTPDFLEAPSLRMDREFAHKELQKEIEEPPAMGMEEWVRLQSDEKVERFGFVVYRLAYQETDQEWDIFKWKLETGLESGLAGLVGADGIKAKATLHWVDGRKHKIAEDDIAAARRHFNTGSFPPGLAPGVFLAVTSLSLHSYASSKAAQRKGDSRGFLCAVDAAFDASDEEDGAYAGAFEMLDQLVWTDLFALHVAAAGQQLKEFWALANRHPRGLYVGPTTGVQRRLWRESAAGTGDGKTE